MDDEDDVDDVLHTFAAGLQFPKTNTSKDEDYFEDYTHPKALDRSHTSWETFTKDLNIACEAICAPHSINYDGVHALLMNWADDDLGTDPELDELDALLRKTFNYSTEVWKIPSKQTEFTVGQKLAQIASQTAGENRLLIVYYGGHGRFDKSGRSIWQAWRNKGGKPKSPTLSWSLLQPSLKSAPCDVLIILDCCYAGSAVRGDIEGTNEIIAACGRESLAEGVTDRSFTKNLMRKIKSFKGQPFTVIQLYERLLKDRRRLITTPQYAPLSARERPSIVLAPIRFELTEHNSDLSTHVSSASVSDETESLASTSQSLMPPPEVSSEMSFESNTSIQSSLPEGPRVLLAVSLRADAGVPDVERWANWFSTDVPYEVQGITVRLEAAYRSHSTLILVSLPVNVWNHLRDTSAYRFIGFVTSVNLLTRGPKDWDQYLEAASVEAATVTDISSFIEASSITDPSSISALEESYPYMSRDPTLAIVKSTNQPTPEMLRPLPQSSAQAERHQKSHTGDLSLHIYESCPLKSGDIRILTVRQGVNSDPIECTLTSRSLETQLSPYHETLPYEALSYHWGSGDCSCKIKIKNEDFQTDFKVKPDLLEALLRLRLPRGARRLWIDAICINQDDMEEKNVQVSLMAEIYSGATHVCVWLGKATSDSNLALNLIRRIINPDHFGPFVTDRLVADGSTLLEWAALSSLMKRAWFNRRWVVQEIALAPRATLYCGNDHIDWSDFADAVSLFEAVESESHTISQSIKLSDNVPDILGEIKLLGATRLVDATSNLFRKSKKGLVLERLLSLEALISTLTVFEASRPHDIIYAVLNLAKGVKPSPATSQISNLVQTQALAATEHLEQKTKEQRLAMMTARKFKQATDENKFIIDYRRPFFDVCKDFLTFTIKAGASLDIICRPWVPEDGMPDDERPSWLLSTRQTAWGVRPDGNYSRSNADTLVGVPGLSSRNYNASGSFRVTSNWRFGEGLQVSCMYVEGFIIDNVATKKAYAAEGNILNEWLSAGGWSDRSAMPPENFWRTLVADRGPNGVNPPTFYPRAIKSALRNSMRNGHIYTNHLINNDKSIVAKSMRRVQEVIWMRRLIVTKHGLLGLAPEMTKKHDSICVLYGCSVPVVLRRVLDPTTKEEYFTFVGESYVHGIMDGEAIALRKERQIDNKVFELR